MAGAKIGIRVLGIVIAIPVGIATRKGVERAWAASGATGRPRRPSEEGVQLADAIAWAALSAVGLVTTDFVARRGAEAAYRVITGNAPPPGKPTDAGKKARKAQEKSGQQQDTAAG